MVRTRFRNAARPAVIGGLNGEGSTCGRLGGDERRDFDMDLSALAFLAADVHLELIAVEEAEALVDVADADASAIDFGETVR